MDKKSWHSTINKSDIIESSDHRFQTIGDRKVQTTAKPQAESSRQVNDQIRDFKRWYDIDRGLW